MAKSGDFDVADSCGRFLWQIPVADSCGRFWGIGHFLEESATFKYIMFIKD